ncbi:MAG: restriction endonuclease subunit S [Anaerolineae bacterium]|nr:restriction endonuclease subunit S [Anaerolineae bacterium]
MMENPWPIVPLAQVIEQRKEFMTIDDLTTYKRCRVQLHAKGVVLRDEIEGLKLKTKKQQVCRADELLVAEIDAKVGGFGLVPSALDGAIVSSHYFLFVIDESKLDKHYLDYYIRTFDFQDQVNARGSTNYAAIRPHHVLGYEIPLPPLAEQRRIVARIEALAAKVEVARKLREATMAEVEALNRSILRNVFHHQLKSAPISTINDVCDAIIDNLHSTPKYSEDGYPCIRSSDVEWGNLNLVGAKRTPEYEYIHRTSRGVPRAGDIVFVREGGGTGKSALVETEEKFSLGQRVMMFRPNPYKVEPKFFLYQILSPYIYEEQIVPRIKGSASPHINISALKQFHFVFPPLPEQRRIVAHLDALQANLTAVQQHQAATQARLDALLPSILDKAFRGELS